MRPGSASVASMTNQRPASRSYFTFGANVAAPLRTDAKNVLVVMFSTPSGAPVAFEKLRMRPFAAKMNCAGPGARRSDPAAATQCRRGWRPVYDCRNVDGLADASSGAARLAASAVAAAGAATGRRGAAARAARERRRCCGSSESCGISCSVEEHRGGPPGACADGRGGAARTPPVAATAWRQSPERTSGGRTKSRPRMWTRIGHESALEQATPRRGGGPGPAEAVPGSERGSHPAVCGRKRRAEHGLSAPRSVRTVVQVCQFYSTVLAPGAAYARITESDSPPPGGGPLECPRQGPPGRRDGFMRHNSESPPL